jgi:NAD(P)H-hydrate epimerase
MQAVTAQEMRELDRLAIEELLIPSAALMENAGREAARVMETVFRQQAGPILILVGKGNNGGDGLIAARHLTEAGYQVQIVYAETPGRLRGDAAIQRDIAGKLGIPAIVYDQAKSAEKSDGYTQINWQQYAGIVDALLGTGARGEPREPYRSLIRQANDSGLPIVALDIPSGLDADTGALYIPHIRATVTVTFAFLKIGLLQYPGAQAAGKVVAVPIGIPTKLAERMGIKTFWISEDLLQNRFQIEDSRSRKADTHKGVYGHVLVVAGSRQMSGAGILCAKAALRTGCGLATWAVPDRLADSLLGQVAEVMLAPLPDGGRGDWEATSVHDVLKWTEGKDAVAVGPGMGRFRDGSVWMRQLWETAKCPLVLDADALNLMAEGIGEWPQRKTPTVITPHPGEMARLTNKTIAEVQADRIGIARQFAMQYGITVVLKGARSIAAAPDGTVCINSTGNPGMATGGTGDVLTGIIASLLAQGYDGMQAACWGMFLHGRAGDLAAERKGERALLASDLIELL